MADTEPWYRRERWLTVGLIAFLPVVVAIFTPQVWKIPLSVLTGLMISTSMLMLFRHLRQIRLREDRERVLNDIAGTRNR